jgi:hypothetical protein
MVGSAERDNNKQIFTLEAAYFTFSFLQTSSRAKVQLKPLHHKLASPSKQTNDLYHIPIVKMTDKETSTLQSYVDSVS